MTIRNADSGDLDAIADLAQDQRLRQQGWEPEFWPLAPNAREVHPLFLGGLVGTGRAIALVSTSAHGIGGYAIAAPLVLPRDRPATWVVDDLGVATASLWSGVGRALLAATAAKVRQAGGARIVTPCAVADRGRRRALEAAGLDLDCWYRHLRLDQPSPIVAEGADDDEPGLPLPHVHGLVSLMHRAESVTADGAHALLSPSIAASPVYRPGGTTALADPVIGVGTGALASVIAAVEDRCRARGDVALLVAVGPGEEPLDAVLDGRGYSRPVEWWTLRPCR